MYETAALTDRAAQIWEEHRYNNLRRTDRLFAGLLAFEWLAGIIAALVISPRAWAGQFSHTHIHVWAAVIMGGAITAFPIVLAFVRPAALLTRHCIAISQMLFGALLIHLTGGRIESHFHVFGSLAFLAFYRDWRVLISASAVVAVDHLVRGYVWPQSVYGVLGGAEWRWLEHAGWVVFEDVFLIASCLRGVRDMKQSAERQALLEVSNEGTEQTVRERTAQLETRNSQLVKATDKLRQEEARTRAIMESAIDCIITADQQGKILEFNPAAERTFGYKRAAALGMKFSQLLVIPKESNGDEKEQHVDSAFSQHFGERTVGEAIRVDGSHFPCEVAINPIAVEGHPLFTAYLRDLTERQQAEQRLARAKNEKIMAEAANQAKSDFLSRMSHELRTPLNAILGFGQLLEMNQLASDQRECVEQINRGGKHLLGLINEVLDIARIEARRMDVSLEPLHVADLFQETLDMVRPLAESRGIRLRSDPAGVNGHCVLADHQKLKQVLLNLLSNAVKYNRDKGEVTLSSDDTTTGRLRLTVTDTGPGIPEDKLTRLFVPFDRLGAEQSGIEGSGLGLSLSKCLVELMGGTLIATSTVGIGSRFCIELPLEQFNSRSVPDITGVAAPPQAVSISEVRTILYIEDNLDNLRLVECIVAHRPGIQLLTAMQGSLGLDLAHQHRPNLILLDVHLPDLSGDQVLQRLQLSPETRSIPVVVISADATESQQARLRMAGALDYLTKPIDVSRFLGVVDAMLAVPSTAP